MGIQRTDTKKLIDHALRLHADSEDRELSILHLQVVIYLETGKVVRCGTITNQMRRMFVARQVDARFDNDSGQFYFWIP